MQLEYTKSGLVRKGTRPQTLRNTTRYCIPTYASPDNGRVPATPTKYIWAAVQK